MMAMKSGDVLEVKLTGGLAYVQATFLHESNSGPVMSHGWFVRVLAGVFQVRPTEGRIQELTQGALLFCCFLERPHQLKKVGKFSLPEHAQAFPIFKQVNGVIPTPEGTWILWNGEEERVTFRLPRVAASFPNREVIDVVVLQDRIQRSWIPAHDVPEACLSLDDQPFSFKDFPLLSEFTADPNKFGDLIGFLRAKGLVHTVDSSEGVEVWGPDFWENDIAQKWLRELPSTGGWDEVLVALVKFKSHHVRSAIDSARAYAAMGTLLQKHDSVSITVGWGDPPPQVVREAMVVSGQLLQRCGLCVPMEISGYGARWRELLNQYQTAVVSLITRFAK
jgi:hypothetical protein